VTELAHVARHEPNEVAHCFAIYKELEPGKGTGAGGWADRFAAETTVTESRRRFDARPSAQ